MRRACSGRRQPTGRVDEHVVRPIGRRIEKLERASSGGCVFVVTGYSDEEHQRQIDEAIASGKAAPDTLFACIKKLSYEERWRPKPDDREG